MRLAHIALGANLPSPAGPPDATLAAALQHIASLGRIAARSSLYSTAPVGFADQPRFLNAVVALSTDLAPRVLLDALLSIERLFGRDRSAGLANGPRTLASPSAPSSSSPSLKSLPMPSIPAPASPPPSSSLISLRATMRARSSSSRASSGPANRTVPQKKLKADG